MLGGLHRFKVLKAEVELIELLRDLFSFLSEHHSPKLFNKQLQPFDLLLMRAGLLLSAEQLPCYAATSSFRASQSSRLRSGSIAETLAASMP